MNKLLETLYHSLYTPLEQAELQSEISSCHHRLTERLDKSEHKLLLKLVDDYDHFVDMQSMDSFLCGLKLGLDLAYELKRPDVKFCVSVFRQSQEWRWKTGRILAWIP